MFPFNPAQDGKGGNLPPNPQQQLPHQGGFQQPPQRFQQPPQRFQQPPQRFQQPPQRFQQPPQRFQQPPQRFQQQFQQSQPPNFHYGHGDLVPGGAIGPDGNAGGMFAGPSPANAPPPNMRPRYDAIFPGDPQQPPMNYGPGFGGNNNNNNNRNFPGNQPQWGPQGPLNHPASPFPGEPDNDLLPPVQGTGNPPFVGPHNNQFGPQFPKHR